MNDFAEVLKNLDTDLRYRKIILLNHQDNYVGRSSMMSCKVLTFH